MQGHVHHPWAGILGFISLCTRVTCQLQCRGESDTHVLFFLKDAEFTAPFVTPICPQQLSNYTLVIKADQTMKDRESPGPTLSFIPADSSAYSCASKETIISRIPTMHIKRVLNWEAFEYPSNLMSPGALRELWSELELRLLKLQLRCLGKRSLIHRVSLKAHFSPPQTNAVVGWTFRNSRSAANHARPQRWLLGSCLFSLSSSWVHYPGPWLPLSGDPMVLWHRLRHILLFASVTPQFPAVITVIRILYGFLLPREPSQSEDPKRSGAFFLSHSKLNPMA